MLTPMMQQYMQIKENYKDCILFFRLGDFYEMFFGDAETASGVLGITLTGKDCGLEERAPMCGVPFHSCDPYIAKLVEAGYKVAICEQTQDPSQCKGIVERQVVKVITPGTITLPDAVDENKNNFIVMICKNGSDFGFSASDATTGELYSTSFSSESAKSDLLSELSKYAPSEIIYNNEIEEDTSIMRIIRDKFNAFMQKVYFEANTEETAYSIIVKHYGEFSKKEFEENKLAYVSAASLLKYLEDTQMTDLDHMKKVQIYSSTQYLGLDSTARANLELVKTMRDGNKKGSLLSVLDRTCTPMGGRMISGWIRQPLVSCNHIKRRLDAVEELFNKHTLRADAIEGLKKINDIERLVSKLEYQTVNGRDLLALKDSILSFPKLYEVFSECESNLILELYTEFDLLEDIYKIIDEAIDPEAPLTIREGDIIKRGYDLELDGWKDGKKNGTRKLRELEAYERERTGIKKLKVSYNKVFGYYIEVTKSEYDKVPENYIRKQTLVNAERFITPELKEIEDIVLRSDEKIVNREYQIFCEIREKIKGQLARIQRTARVIAIFDVLCCFAEVSVKNNYVKPEVDPGDVIEIKNGRHPVVEHFITDCLFVPNDTILDRDKDLFSIITGPNMAGKSTYMRQVAIIVLMAQMGCFVPASSARIGIVDKIFTRIGASDDLSSGQSTFMVEMNEASNIIKNATERSLIILDEIGRGTSTFDGLAIAWSIVEHISDKKKLGARTLFATHYHELTQLEEKIDNVKNYCITARKRNDDIVFLRKIVRGGADESYGIEVAKLAGVPDDVIKRAKVILKNLETDAPDRKYENKKSTPVFEENLSINMFDGERDELIEEIKKIDINILSPIEAMNKLFELKNKADKI